MIIIDGPSRDKTCSSVVTFASPVSTGMSISCGWRDSVDDVRLSLKCSLPSGHSIIHQWYGYTEKPGENRIALTWD